MRVPEEIIRLSSDYQKAMVQMGYYRLFIQACVIFLSKSKAGPFPQSPHLGGVGFSVLHMSLRGEKTSARDRNGVRTSASPEEFVWADEHYKDIIPFPLTTYQ